MTRQMKRWQPRYPALAGSLRAARVRAHLSQHDIAFHLRIPQPAYWLLERGMNRPTAAQLPVLAALLELDAAELAVLADYTRPGEGALRPAGAATSPGVSRG
jgi:transcriptional regulator with XRE-family HTH domain